jgi:hypothetical protein
VYPSLPWQSCATWAAAFVHCKEHCQPLHPSDFFEPADLEPPLDDFVAEEHPDKDEHDPMALLAGETTLRNPAARYEDPDNLGDRTDDWTYDWSLHVDTYRGNSDPMPDVHAGIHWWSRARELHPSYAQIRLLSQQTVQSLAPEQRLIFDLVMNHFTSGNLSPLLLSIDGRAGTGKSFIIQVLSAQLSLASHSDETILRSAPTGAASFGIGGSTVDSLLKLPINKPIEPLGAAWHPASNSALHVPSTSSSTRRV